jgi:uncharacterized protein YdeI (YjbR/CyaY-like superfamily)
MAKPNVSSEVDRYLLEAKQWPDELRAVRSLLLNCGLDESLKWNKPCYSDAGKNIAILQEMKSFLALMFFKGALLTDPAGVLRDQGPNSRSARRVTFTSIDDVTTQSKTITALVAQAIEVERSGRQVPAANPLELAAELRSSLDADDALATAFAALTPGRQREYNLYITGAKQSTTRQRRIEACVPRILTGKGLRDR